MAFTLRDALCKAETNRALVTSRYLEASNIAIQAQIDLEGLEARRKALAGVMSFTAPYCSPEVNDQICEVDVAMIELRPALQNALDIVAALEKEAAQAHASEAEAKAEYEAELARVLRQENDAREAEEVERKRVQRYSSMTEFPAIPVLDGDKHALSCRNKDKSRPIDACECAVRKTFLGTNLLEQCSFWTPSNFQHCAPDVRDDFVCKAEYVHGIVNDMYAKAEKPGAAR